MKRLRTLLVPLIALAGSQAGHLVAHLARYGPAGLIRQGQGSHGYFPALAGGLSSLLAAGVVVSLLVLAAARLRRGRRLGLRAHPPPSLFDLIAVLFTLQLAIYLGQETIESAAAGAAPMPLPELLVWAAIGQLPVALLGSLALSWLSVRLEAAASELSAEPAPIQAWPAIPEPVPACAAPAVEALRVCAPAVFVKRGPPPNLPGCG
jgi:hypothetical protein